MKSLSFIGTGKMASALISCIYEKGIAKEIIASGKDKGNLKNLKSKYRIKTTKDNIEAVRNSDIVFVCVKPQDVGTVLNEIKYEIKDQLIVSIAAGISTKKIEKIIGRKRVIRVMPNINCIVGEMAAGFSKGKYATKKDAEDVLQILDSSGVAFEVKEELLDAITGLSGSGPAFFAYFIDALARGGIKEGLDKKTAYRLAAQTALGTGKLLLEKKITPLELIEMVASKRGTTEKGLKVLDRHKTKDILIKTVSLAAKRSKELGK